MFSAKHAIGTGCLANFFAISDTLALLDVRGNCLDLNAKLICFCECQDICS